MTIETSSSLSLLPKQEGTIKVASEMLPSNGHVGVYLPGGLRVDGNFTYISDALN